MHQAQHGLPGRLAATVDQGQRPPQHRQSSLSAPDPLLDLVDGAQSTVEQPVDRHDQINQLEILSELAGDQLRRNHEHAVASPRQVDSDAAAGDVQTLAFGPLLAGRDRGHHRQPARQARQPDVVQLRSCEMADGGLGRQYGCQSSATPPNVVVHL